MSTERANDPLITVHVPAFLVLAIAGNQKCLSNMAINWVGRKFENNLQTALKESLALFPVDELKAEHGAETYRWEEFSHMQISGWVSPLMSIVEDHLGLAR